MEQRFRGEFDLKVDTKGRMSVPPAFRRALEAEIDGWESGQPVKCVVLRNADNRPCLQFYGMREYAELERIVMSVPKFSPQRKKVSRKLGAASDDLVVDDSGRVVLSEKLRAKAGITPGAPLIGAGMVDYFELWTAENYEADEEGTGAWCSDEPAPDDLYVLINEIRAAYPDV